MQSRDYVAEHQEAKVECCSFFFLQLEVQTLRVERKPEPCRLDRKVG